MLGCRDERIEQSLVVDVVVQVLFGGFEAVELFDAVVVLGDVGELELLHVDVCGVDLDVHIVGIGPSLEQLTLHHEGIGELLLVESRAEVTPCLLHPDHLLVSLLNSVLFLLFHPVLRSLQLSQLLGRRYKLLLNWLRMQLLELLLVLLLLLLDLLGPGLIGGPLGDLQRRDRLLVQVLRVVGGLVVRGPRPRRDLAVDFNCLRCRAEQKEQDGLINGFHFIDYIIGLNIIIIII